jgi:hypothetical protein
MNPIKLIKLMSLYHRFEDIQKEKLPMNGKVVQYTTLASSLFATIGLPQIALHWIQMHEIVYLSFVAVALLLHAALPSIFTGSPNTDAMKATGFTKIPMILMAFFLFGTMCQGQVSFDAAAGPAAVYYNHEWSAGSYQRESFDLVDWGSTKDNHLMINGTQLEMPTPGLNLYMGGLVYKPNLNPLFKKTNLPAGTLGAFFDGSAGNGVPSVGGSHVSWMAGGGVLFRASQSVAWQPLTVQYGRFGTTGFVAMSTQLQYFFGK